MDAPDLSLRAVAFVRTVDGRVADRGTAARLDYRRAGGRIDADIAAMTLAPRPGSQLTTYGNLQFKAPRAQGESVTRGGRAWGGVLFGSARGDHGETESVEYDGRLIHGEQPVALRGPGYVMHGHGLAARDDGSQLALKNGVEGTLEQGQAR
jgi:hypothetical protein